MKTLYIDIETYSETDLKDAGVYRYVEDPSWEILMAAYSIDGGPVQYAEGPEEVERIPGLWEPDVVKVAHNAAFERVNFSELVRRRHPGSLDRGEYIAPEGYRDTMAEAAAAGLPQSLSALAKALEVPEKDEAGTRLINLFSRPRRGVRVTAQDKPAEWLEFIDYCVQDVETLIAVAEALPGLGDREWEVYLADQRINDRGIRIDLELARRAVEAAEDNERRNVAELRRITGVENPNSVAQLRKWTKLPDLRKETVEAALPTAQGDLKRVLELRQELALVASKKFTAALNGVCADGRLRGQFRYFGAHTGRWTGRGVQLQNLPRAALKNDTEVLAALLDLNLGLGADDATLKALVRPLFVGPYVVVDYSAIEARVIAWLAGEQWALDAFAAGRDIYVETAERMSTPTNKLDRSQGKVAVLALGYNGGIGSLKAMGADGSLEELGALVGQWRKANPRIVNLWRDLENAFRRGGTAGRLKVRAEKDIRYLVLPSGRELVYRGVRHRVEVLPDGRTRTRASFSSAYSRTDTYGGRLAENATQATARDVLADAMVRLDAAGYRVVGHIHDEVLVEARADAYDDVRALMIQNPSWADGLPLNGEGFTSYRYKKG